MVGINQNQGYPQTSVIADPRGNVTQPWRQFFIAIWNRTGAQIGGSVQASADAIVGGIAFFFAPTVISSGNLSGDVTTNNNLVTTLKTVNGNIGSFTLANITVNNKGLVTAASSGHTTGLSTTIVTAQLTPGGTQGSMTFVNGLLTAQTPAT